MTTSGSRTFAVKATASPSKKRRREASEDTDSTAIPTPAESTSTHPPPAKKRKRTKPAAKPQATLPTLPTATLAASPSSKAASVAARTQQVLDLLQNPSTAATSSKRKGKGKHVAPPSESDSDSVFVARAPTPAPVIASLASLPRRQVVVSAVDPLHALRRALFPPGWYEEPAAEPMAVDVEEVAVQTSPAPGLGPSDAELDAARIAKATRAAEKKARKKAKKAAEKASLATSQATVATVADAPAPPAPVAPELVANTKQATTGPDVVGVTAKRARERTQDAIVEAEGSAASGSQRSTGSARKTKRVRGKKAQALLPSSRSASPGAIAPSPAVSAEPATRDPSPAAALVSPNDEPEAEFEVSGPTILVTAPPAMEEDLQVVEDSADDAEIDELEGATQREQASPSVLPDPEAQAPEDDLMDVDELEGSTQRAQVEPSPELHGGVELAPADAPTVRAPTPTPEASEPTVAPEVDDERSPSPVPEAETTIPVVAPSPEPERQQLSSPPTAQHYATIGAPENNSDSSSSDDSSDSDDSDDEPTPAKKKARMSIGALAAEAFGRSPAKGRKPNTPSLPPSQLSQVLATADDAEDLEWLQSQSARKPNSALAKLLASNDDDEAEDADEEGSRSSRFSSVAASDEEGRKPTFERQPAAAPLADDDSDTETPGATTPVAQEIEREEIVAAAEPDPDAAVPGSSVDAFARESPPTTQEPIGAPALQAASPPPEASTSELPASPTHSESGSTLAVPPGRRLMSISGHTSDAEQLDDTTFSSQPIESSQFDDPLFPESQYVPLVKDQPLFLESQETQETQAAAGPSSVAEQRGELIRSVVCSGL